MYNYSKLRGILAERDITQDIISQKINIAKSSFNLKMNNKAMFKQNEISCIVQVLDIPRNLIGEYFFNNIV